MGAETVLARKIDKVLKSHKDLWFLNTYGNAIQKSGVPDRLICYHGYFIGMEIKRPDKKGVVSNRQEIEGLKIQKAEGIFIVVESVKEVIDLLDFIDKTNNKNM